MNNLIYYISISSSVAYILVEIASVSKIAFNPYEGLPTILDVKTRFKATEPKIY